MYRFIFLAPMALVLVTILPALSATADHLRTVGAV